MSEAAPSSIRQWLSALGLAQYADRFEQQAIDFEVLPNLSDAQFKQLGVKVLGHKMKLMQAIAALNQVPPGASSGPQPAPVAPAPGPERRQISVMFCDLVGSTSLSQQLDPEDLRLLMHRYQRTVAAAVQRYDGHIARYVGDGVLIYFGWPRAHEDDAVRTLQAALEIVDAVRTIAAAEPLHVRVGVATGPVVVGETSGGDPSLPNVAIGETPNLAARMQALAQPDQVVVAASTRRLVAEAFDCQDLGEHALKGIAQPVRVWRVLGEGRAEDRFAATHGSRQTPMVNRDREIWLLLELWSRACEGKGQAVLLVGEPGIGKSRITAELLKRVGPQSVFCRAQCSEVHCNSAYYPLIGQFARAAGFERGDAPELKLDKLEALLARIGAAPGSAPFIAALLTLPLTRYPALRASAQKQKQDTIEALVATVLAAARKDPVVVLFEDVHWVDPSTLEVLDAIADAVHRAPILLVMTSRNDLERRWAARAQFTTRALAGLSRSHSLQLAGAVAVSHGVPERVLERIIEHSEGVPLFIEEVTRAVLEGEELRGEAVAEMAPDRLDAIEIPPTLKDSLSARLDQLGSAKRVAQLGSVLGRQFRHDVILALSGMAEPDLPEQVRRLVESGFVTASGSAPGVLYTFHHALFQDAAYESLLKSDRRTLHAQVGELLAAQFAEVAEFEPEVLARHFTAGEVWDKAMPLWLKAGQRAWLRSAAQEAIAHLSAGLALVDRVADTAARDSLELQLQVALGAVYFAAVSYAAPQAQAAFLRAQALCERVPDLAMKVPVLYGVGAFQTLKGDTRTGHRTFEHLRSQVDAAPQPRLQLRSETALAWSHFNCAKFVESVAAADRGLRLYEAGAMAGPRLTVADPKVVCECFRAVSLWSLGHADRARAASDAVLAHARALGELYSLAYTLNWAALAVPELCGEHSLVLERSEEGIRLASELGYPYLEVQGTLSHIWAMAQEGDAVSALRSLDQAMARLGSMGMRYLYPLHMSRKARLLLRVGQVGAAQLAISEAVAQVESSGEYAFKADVIIAEGEVLCADGGEQRSLAASSFRMALDVAREQGARAWQLRAALALARMAAEDGDTETARATLVPVLEGLTEGHDTADLRQAAALLATLT